MFCEVDSKNVCPVYICASGTTPEHGTGITVVAFGCVARTVDLYGNLEDILFTRFCFMNYPRCHDSVSHFLVRECREGLEAG